ncbi:MAG: NAD(P)/FAD-dependent oxidoreductase [Steroidobacteraceae bacterium]
MNNTRSARRRFLITGSAALAGLGTSWRASAREAEFDVAIVGAGLAGLNAAMILADLGANVVVLEATQRVGGRVHTADRWHLQPDLGGVQIGRDYARVLDVAHRLGVKLGPGAHVNAPYSFVVGDTLVPARDWERSPLNRTEGAERVVPPHALGGYFIEQRNPLRSLDAWLTDAAAEYDISVAQWLARQGASAEALRIIRVSQGRPLEDLSLLRMLQEASRGKFSVATTPPELLAGKDQYERGAVMSQHVVGGTSRLVEAMAATLGTRVRRGRQVTAIELDDGRCALHCADGSRLRARFAIAAVPVTVLREIAVTPGLRGAQGDAVRRMPYGNQSQVWLRVREPYWEKDGIEASMWTDGAFNLIRQQIESDGRRELISALAFSEQSRRLDAMPLAERGRFAIAEIERIRPATRGQLEFVGAHSWEQSPFERGCSFQMVPGRALAWARSMGRPHLSLHFAGEHLRTLEVGMEGAMESGERAAREVAERLLA